MADALRREISAGSPPGGTELRVRELAARFHISATPVLAALKHLEAEGYLTVNARRGVSVAVLSTDDLEELTVMRAALERYAVGLAAPLAGEATIRAMQRRLRKQRPCSSWLGQRRRAIRGWTRNCTCRSTRPRGARTLVSKIQQLRERSTAYMFTAALGIAGPSACVQRSARGARFGGGQRRCVGCGRNDRRPRITCCEIAISQSCNNERRRSKKDRHEASHWDSGRTGAVGSAYSQAIVSNGLVFVAGQGPLDSATREVVGDGVVTQTRQVRGT